MFHSLQESVCCHFANPSPNGTHFVWSYGWHFKSYCISLNARSHDNSCFTSAHNTCVKTLQVKVTPSVVSLHPRSTCVKSSYQIITLVTTFVGSLSSTAVHNLSPYTVHIQSPCTKQPFTSDHPLCSKSCLISVHIKSPSVLLPVQYSVRQRMVMTTLSSWDRKQNLIHRM